jgi:hypothetical protein
MDAESRWNFGLEALGCTNQKPSRWRPPSSAGVRAPRGRRSPAVRLWVRGAWAGLKRGLAQEPGRRKRVKNQGQAPRAGLREPFATRKRRHAARGTLAPPSEALRRAASQARTSGRRRQNAAGTPRPLRRAKSRIGRIGRILKRDKVRDKAFEKGKRATGGLKAVKSTDAPISL